jgi:hypothetical protein
MIGLLPASGHASRMRGLPKFLLPTITGETLLEYHARLMHDLDIPVRVCTSQRWLPLVRDLLDGSCELVHVAPSTMNRAVIDIAEDDNIIGMPDTFFTDGNPYAALHEAITIGLWRCPESLRGKVGQVDYDGNSIRDIIDKNPDCDYAFMWGVLRLSRDAVTILNPEHAHPGIDLPRIITTHPYAVAVNAGDYIDVGTPTGLRDMLNHLA